MDHSSLRSKLIRTLNPWQGHGGVVVLANVHELNEESLRWLLDVLTSFNEDVDDNERQWFHSLARGVVFVLTSDEIGRPSLIRHTREGAAGSSASLMLDLRHDWQGHGLQSAGASSSIAILPHFALDREWVQQYAHFRLNEILENWHVQHQHDDQFETLVPTSQGTVLIVADAAFSVLFSWLGV